jgi:hypothetical protein
LNRPGKPAALDDLAGDHLALAVGVGGDHQFGRPRQQVLHDPELRRRRSLDFVAPYFGKNGQRFDCPAFVALAVAFGRRGFQ